MAFGSNVGQRERYIREAAEQVASFLSDFRLSEIIETLPVGAGTEHDPPFLNAVGVGESDLPPRELLDRLRAIEDAAGRERSFANAPRTLDLDLILAGNAMVNDRDLQLPHPRFRDRRFVLGPLVELEPDLKDPATGRTVWELLSQLAD